MLIVKTLDRPHAFVVQASSERHELRLSLSWLQYLYANVWQDQASQPRWTSSHVTPNGPVWHRKNPRFSK
jgi:hypothetical protein